MRYNGWLDRDLINGMLISTSNYISVKMAKICRECYFVVAIENLSNEKLIYEV